MRRKRTARKKAQGTPVFVSGVGGVAFEDETAAYILAAMLADQPPFGETVGRITQIDWQVDDSGWRFDDLVLTCPGEGSPRVAISCKSGRYVSSRDGWPTDAANRLWHQWTDSAENPFRREKDLMAVVVGTLAGGVSDAWSALLQEASVADPTRFVTRYTRSGRTSPVGRALFASLKRPDIFPSSTSSELDERVALARRTRLWHRDLIKSDSKDRTQAVEWCRQSLLSRDRDEADRLYNDLRSCENAVQAVSGQHSLPDDAAGLSIFDEFSESFAGEWAVARLAAGDTRPFPRRVLAEAMTAGEHTIAGQVWRSAVRHAKGMPSELTRLCNLIWLWAAIRCRFKSWMRTHEEQNAQERWRQWVVNAYAAGRISVEASNWERLRLRAAQSIFRDERRQRAKKRAREDVLFVSDDEPPQPNDWIDYKDHGFDWSYLSKIAEHSQVLLRPSEAPHLAALGECNRRIVDILTHGLRQSPTRDYGSSDIPTHFDLAAMAIACKQIAGHEDQNVAMGIWRRLAPYLAARESWVELFFDTWFLIQRERAEVAARFHQRWRLMIDMTLILPEWKGVDGVWSFEQQRAVSAMLGLGSHGSNLGLRADAPHLECVLDWYAEWARQCLDARHRMHLFCGLLMTPGASELRPAALPWISSALESSTGRRSDFRQVLEAVAAVLIVSWHQNGDALLTVPDSRAAFLRILDYLTRHQVPGFQELRDDVEAALAGELV